MISNPLELCAHQVAQPGTLYVIATPLGNLGDLTLRSIQIWETCDCIACETPSITRKILISLGLEKKHLFTYRDAGEEKSAQHLLVYLKSGKSVALVSDAGTPTISDPGYRLVRLCQEQQQKVIPIPGPSAGIAALSVSGFPSHQFLFLGFLPIKQGPKQKLLQQYCDFEGTLILYESPFRIQKLIEILQQCFEPERQLFVARELTKQNETFYRGTLATFDASMCPAKGEYVVLIEPKH